jgi:hypothetical protein
MERPPLESLVENMKAVTDRRQNEKVLHKLEEYGFVKKTEPVQSFL